MANIQLDYQYLLYPRIDPFNRTRLHVLWDSFARRLFRAIILCDWQLGRASTPLCWVLNWPLAASARLRAMRGLSKTQFLLDRAVTLRPVEPPGLAPGCIFSHGSALGVVDHGVLPGATAAADYFVVFLAAHS